MNEHETLNRDLGRIENAVRAFARFRKRWALFDGAARTVLFGLGSLLLWFALDWAFGLPPWPLFLLFAAACGVGVWVLVRSVLLPAFGRLSTEREAVLIEDRHGELDNRLIGSLQLGHELADAYREDRVRDHSAVMVRLLVRRTVESLSTLNLKGLVPRRGTWRLLAAAGGVIAIASLVAGLAWPTVVERGQRLGNAWATVLDTLFPVELHVEPGDRAVVRGHSVPLRVHAEGAHRREIFLVRTDIETLQSETNRLVLDDDRAAFTVSRADVSFTYHFAYGRRSSDLHEIRVADLPGVQAINYELTPPPYTGRPMRMLTGRLSKLQALPGTAVLVSFAATTPLDPGRCVVEWESGAKQRIDVSGRFGSFAFSVDGPDRATVRLTGHYGPGFEMPDPLRFDIVVTSDQRPTIQWVTRLPKTELTGGEARNMEFRWFAKDDFGVQEVTLQCEVDVIEALKVTGRGKRTSSRKQLVDPPRDRVTGSFMKIFNELQPGLAPGDKVTISLTARDNNTETGPGFSRSEPLEFVVVGVGFAGWTDDAVGSIQAREHSALGLQEWGRTPRSTDLMQPVEPLFKTEKPREIAKHDVQSPVGQEITPALGQDGIGRYLELLSGAGGEL